MKKYDVLIVGFGPTGGTLANLLAQHGFSILIVEKEKSFSVLLHTRTFRSIKKRSIKG